MIPQVHLGHIEQNMDDSGYVPFINAIEHLLRLCMNHRSGNMFLCTLHGDGAKISLSHGNIIGIKYKTYSDREALEHMREIDRAKYIFKKDQRLREMKVSSEIPPSHNDDILMEFGLRPAAEVNGEFSSSTRKKVLVVEDSGMARKAVVNLLITEGFDVMEARDGLEAVAKLQWIIPDMVLLDLILPKVDGYDVLYHIKNTEKFKNIPVVVLTSRDTLFDKLKGKMSGTDEYLTKPVHPDALLQILEKFLR